MEPILMVRNKSTGNKSSKRILIYSFAGAGLVVIVLLSLNYAGVLSINPGGDPIQTPTAYKFIFNNYTSVLDGNDGRAEATGYLYEYEYDPDTFTDSIKNKLKLTDFTLLSSVYENNDTKTPEANTLYLMKINCTGHGDKWIVPVLGDNNVKLRTTPTNISLGMHDIYGSSTENQTNSPYWYGSIFCVDADGELNNACGYDLAYDLTLMTKLELFEDSMLYPVLVIDCNGTGIEVSDISLSGLSVKIIQINSDKIEIYLNQPIYGKMDFSLDIDADDLGVDFEIESIYLARGILGGSLTTLATA